MKVCLVGGAGGHLRELVQIENVLERETFECFFVTIDTPFTRSLEKAYLIPLLGNDLPRLLVTNIFNLLFALKIILRESPEVVIATGPEFAIPYCVLSKIRRKESRTFFVESLCRFKAPSATGRIIGPFVDYYLVQWPQTMRHSPKKAKYWGRVI